MMNRKIKNISTRLLKSNVNIKIPQIMTTKFFNRIKISQVLLTFSIVLLAACTEDVNEEFEKEG